MGLVAMAVYQTDWGELGFSNHQACKRDAWRHRQSDIEEPDCSSRPPHLSDMVKSESDPLTEKRSRRLAGRERRPRPWASQAASLCRLRLVGFGWGSVGFGIGAFAGQHKGAPEAAEPTSITLVNAGQHNGQRWSTTHLSISTLSPMRPPQKLVASARITAGAAGGGGWGWRLGVAVGGGAGGWMFYIPGVGVSLSITYSNLFPTTAKGQALALNSFSFPRETSPNPRHYPQPLSSSLYR